jgi:chromosome segregation ATPase
MLDESDHPADQAMAEMQRERNELTKQLSVSESHTPRMRHAEAEAGSLRAQLASLRDATNTQAAAAAAELNDCLQQLVAAKEAAADAAESQLQVRRALGRLL